MLQLILTYFVESTPREYFAIEYGVRKVSVYLFLCYTYLIVRIIRFKYINVLIVGTSYNLVNNLTYILFLQIKVDGISLLKNIVISLKFD